MPTTRIKEKISTLVNSQLPEFIRSDYTTFVTFIEAYYKFLEQDQGALEIVQNARSYNDIDTTTDAFVNYFLNNYAQDIPAGVLADKGLLVKRIRDLYESKGSEVSFKLLFQLLYNEPVEVTYPYENVLVASGGEWYQKTTIRVALVSGSVSDISDRYLDLTQNGLVYRTSIISTKFLAINFYELVLEPKELAPYVIGDTVTVSNNTAVIFTGTVSSTTVELEIKATGSGFRVAQIFNINISDAVGTQLQVLSVNATGGITKLRFLSYGYNYTKDLSVVLDPTSSVASYIAAKRSRTLGFVDTISILGSYGGGDANRYFDTDYNSDTPLSYTANTLSSTTTVVAVSPGIAEGVVDPTLATIDLTIGVIARYPGGYISNKGFLSDDIIRLQDEKQYQPFAYRTESTLELSSFYDIVTKLIHPAGQRLFNNRVLTNTINAVANVSVITRSNIFTELNDKIKIIDNGITWTDNILVDQDPEILDSISVSFRKNFTDSVDIQDTITFFLTKVITDEIIADEVISNTAYRSISEEVNVTELITVSEVIAYTSVPDTIILSESISFTRVISLADSSSIDDSSIFNISKVLSEEITVLELSTLNTSKPVADESPITDTTSLNTAKTLNDTADIIETIAGILANYDAESYFSDTYAGDPIAFA